MTVRYQAQGKLGEILRQFQVGYLRELQPQDLDVEVVLRVDEVQTETIGLQEQQDSARLKERLLEVIQDECEG